MHDVNNTFWKRDLKFCGFRQMFPLPLRIFFHLLLNFNIFKSDVIYFNDNHHCHRRQWLSPFLQTLLHCSFGAT